MTALTLPQTNGSQAGSPMNSWLQSTVRDFFTTINWEDRPPDIQPLVALPLEESTDEPLNLGMSVCKFFGSFNWDGAEIAAPVKVQPTAFPPQSDFTLDDFSGLF
jgi:hypothetical protein